jgi:rRNA maturation RNase YbeY
MAVQKKEKFTVSNLQVNILNSEYILELNKKYLKHDYNTDVITFNYSGSNENLDGEIFISFQDALGNALKFNVHLDIEILRLIIHGILHLLGYDDLKVTDKKMMAKKEDNLVDTFQSNYRNIIIKYDC